MKDGAAHPTSPGSAWDSEREEWVGIRAPHCGQPHRENWPPYAAELERIVDRYRDKTPSPSSRQALEIELAASLLYKELYRDCGQEARRQKLRGLHLLRCFIQAAIEQARPKDRKINTTNDEINKWRAFIVADLMRLGITNTGGNQQGPSVFEVAAEIAQREGWPLGGESSFRSAFYSWKKAELLRISNGRTRAGYRRITKADLEGIHL